MHPARSFLRRSSHRLVLLLGGLALALPLAGPAAAEGRIRLAEQFGIGYLPLHVIRHHNLIEKHGRALGLDIAVEWAQLSGGAAMNDALLSGSIDVAAGGIAPLLTIWDRTKGSANVKAIATLNNLPIFLNSNNPNVRSVKDLTDKDRITVPSVKVSIQARTLQIAAEQAFGEGKFDVLDKLTVAVPHPDATAALLSGSSEITATLSTPPFQYQQLQNPKVHRVFSSYELLGGPHTANLVWAKESFRTENPKTYQAFAAALREAIAYINENREGAAQAYIAVNGTGVDAALLKMILADPDIQYTTDPINTGKYADFMHKVGALKNKPASWKDYFFEDAHAGTGS